jgi:hypothetical protein
VDEEQMKQHRSERISQVKPKLEYLKKMKQSMHPKATVNIRQHGLRPRPVAKKARLAKTSAKM